MCHILRSRVPVGYVGVGNNNSSSNNNNVGGSSLKELQTKQPDTLPHSKLVVKNKVESTIICVSSQLANIRRCCAKSAYE